ncbi:MAG: lytic transglycosylase domain-containing protein [Rhodovarius sp.]|nr:lytic transglycosylase domain-containing protein [Rhodovarius sp.]MDW8313450.1 lytic transglycosylase domain-containing protein [Rhodovarius sp.]
MTALAQPPRALAAPGLCRAAIALAEREANIPPGLLQAIGQVESGRRDPATGEREPWPWTVHAEGQGRFFPDRAAAVAAVRELQGRGVRLIDVGCLQVNLHHHPQAFASLEEAFDPLANARYAARYLRQLQEGRGDWLLAAGHYHSHTPHLAEAYRARVAAAWPAEQARLAAARLSLAALRPASATPGGSGAAGLSNRAEAARLLPSAAGAGRGLDAYRAAPVPIAGRSPAAAAPPSPAAGPPRGMWLAAGPGRPLWPVPAARP